MVYWMRNEQSLDHHAMTSTHDLIAQLSSSDYQTRLAAAYRIGSQAAASSIPLLLNALADGRPECRHAALIALRVLHSQANARKDAQLRVLLESDKVIDALARALRDSYQEAVIAASMALQMIATPAARSALDEWRDETGCYRLKPQARPRT